METEFPDLPRLETDLHVDVCVVGAGIAGLTTAYLLARAGKSVAVIDSNPLSCAQSLRTTAHLSSVLDSRYFNLERVHGINSTRTAVESHMAAIHQIEAIIEDEDIQCDFERLDGYLFAPSHEQSELINREYQSAKRIGVTEVEFLLTAPLDFWETGPCLRFPNQAQFHPAKYLLGLIDAIHRLNGQIFSHTRATRICGGKIAQVDTDGAAKIMSSSVIVATNTPINDRFVVHTKQAAYRSYAIGARIPAGSVGRALYWDTLDPFHYVRVASVLTDWGSDSEMLIVGGEDHKTGQKENLGNPFTMLERWTRRVFPMIESVDYRWSGQIMESVDGLAFIGRNPADNDNVYIATGDCGNGMTYGTIAGILIRDLILGHDNDWKQLYDPSRTSLRSSGEYISENANAAVQYTDWLTPGEVDTVNQIARGSGAILRRGCSKIAVYRNPNGRLIELSAVCPHLKGIVSWNPQEKTWDCPCHGSRFAPNGTVINGPSTSGLEGVKK